MTGWLLALTLLLAPLYAWRFTVSGAPVNLLMLFQPLLWLGVAVAARKKDRLASLRQGVAEIPKTVLLGSGALLIGATFGFILKNPTQDGAGVLLVLFMQPTVSYLAARWVIGNDRGVEQKLLLAAEVLLATLGAAALIQYLTLWHLPVAFWGNSVEPKRAVGLFSHPNFLALFVTPLLAFLLPTVGAALSNLKVRKNLVLVLAWLLGVAALACSMSRAGWLGLAAAVGVYLVLGRGALLKRYLLILAAVAVLVVAAAPNLRYRVILPFYGEKSAVSRLSLWRAGWAGVAASPIFGLGPGGFSARFDRLNTDPNIDRHNFPHNTFLNFWVESGPLGLFGFLTLAAFGLWAGLLKNRSRLYRFGFALVVVTYLTQGLIDNPYFKNDLALLFWLLLAWSELPDRT